MADEIVLENGNVLTGTIEKVEGGKLFLKTDYSQPIKVQISKIKKITTDKAVDLYLTSGELVKGKVQTAEDGKLVVGPPGQTRDGRIAVAANAPPKAPPNWRGNISLEGTSRPGILSENPPRWGERPSIRSIPAVHGSVCVELCPGQYVTAQNTYVPEVSAIYQQERSRLPGGGRD